MRLKEEHKITIIGLILVLITFLQIVSAFIGFHHSSLLSQQQKDYMDLIHKYNVFQACAAKLGPLLDKEKFYIQTGWGEQIVRSNSIYHNLSEEEQKAWGDRTMMELLYDDMNRVRTAYKNADQKARIAEIDFPAKMAILNKRMRQCAMGIWLLNFLSVVLLFCCMYLYQGALRSITARIKKV